MGTRNVNLTEALDRFVDRMIEGGAYQNASEVIRAGLRLLRAQEDERQARLAAIKAAPPAEEDDAASLLTRSRAPR